MKRHILIFGLAGGVLIAILKWTEYRFLVVEHSLKVYGGLVAAVFALLGIWLGAKLVRKPQPIIADHAAPSVNQPFVPSEQKRIEIGMTPREREILELISQGLSNREIANKLHVSENTIKTHCSRVFEKLGAKRRTQAVQLGKEFGLLS